MVETTEDLKTGNEAGKEEPAAGKEEPAVKPPEGDPGSPPDERSLDALSPEWQKYIKDLREESKDRRLKLTESERKLGNVEVSLTERDEALTNTEKALKDYKEAEEKAKLADASELEKAHAALEKATKKLEEAQTELTNRDAAITKKDEELSKTQITNTVDRMVIEAGYAFLPYQRKGLLQEILVKKDDGSFPTQEEVGRSVEKFIQDNKEPPGAPPGGGKPSGTEPVFTSRLMELTTMIRQGVKLNPEQQKEFDEMGEAVDLAMTKGSRR